MSLNYVSDYAAMLEVYLTWSKSGLKCRNLKMIVPGYSQTVFF